MKKEEQTNTTTVARARTTTNTTVIKKRKATDSASDSITDNVIKKRKATDSASDSITDNNDDNQDEVDIDDDVDCIDDTIDADKYEETATTTTEAVTTATTTTTCSSMEEEDEFGTFPEDFDFTMIDKGVNQRLQSTPQTRVEVVGRTSNMRNNSTSDIIVIHDWDSDSDKEISIPLAPLLRQMTSDDDKEPVVLLPRTGHAETKQTICDGRDEHHERIAIESKIRTYFLIVVLSVSILSFCSWIYTRIVDSK